MAEPTWYPKVAQLLAGGATIKDAAKQLGIGEKTVRRHLQAPGGVLRAMVEQAKAAQAAVVQDELAPLRGKALAVLEKALDANDVGAAKALLAKLVAGPADAPPTPESAAEPEVSPEDAARELALSFPAVADLAREGRLSAQAVEDLRAACRVFLEDDLKLRPPINAEAERVEPVAEDGPRPTAAPDPTPAPAQPGRPLLH